MYDMTHKGHVCELSNGVFNITSFCDGVVHERHIIANSYLVLLLTINYISDIGHNCQKLQFIHSNI